MRDNIVLLNTPTVKKIMITGAGGFIGSHLMRGLMNECEEMIAVDIKLYKHWKIFDIMEEKDIHCKCFSGFDMTIRSEFCSLISKELPDVIFNLAGIPIPELYIQDPGMVIDSILGTFLNLKAGIEVRRCFSTIPYIPLIFQASTSEVYGNNKTYIEDESPRIYGSFKTRRWSYAIAKAMIEEILAGSELRWIVMRFFNIVGFNIDSWGEGRVLTKMIGNALENHEIIVTDDGQQVRAFTHIDDFVVMVQEMLRVSNSTNDKEGNIFNIGGDKNVVTMLELATMIKTTIMEITGINVTINKKPANDFYKGEFEDIRYRVPDMTKWNSHYKTRPKISMSEIVYEMVYVAIEHYGIIISDGEK